MCGNVVPSGAGDHGSSAALHGRAHWHLCLCSHGGRGHRSRVGGQVSRCLLSPLLDTLHPHTHITATTTALDRSPLHLFRCSADISSSSCPSDSLRCLVVLLIISHCTESIVGSLEGRCFSLYLFWSDVCDESVFRTQLSLV